MDKAKKRKLQGDDIAESDEEDVIVKTMKVIIFCGAHARSVAVRNTTAEIYLSRFSNKNPPHAILQDLIWDEMRLVFCF